MKTLKLIIPDHIYQIVGEMARADRVDIGQFAACALSDTIIDESQSRQQEEGARPASTAPVPEVLPDTATQLHEICRNVWQHHQDLNEAIRTAAYTFRVSESTVRDKCTRRINLATMSEFMKLLSVPQDLVEHLCRKFPRHEANLRSLFAPILPKATAAPSIPAQAPPREVSEMDLIAAIIDVLKYHGGRRDKEDVERALYDRYLPIFQHPHYQESLKGGVERWRKKVHFARNTACNTLGLIKPPEQSGRGIWELTDKGRSWVRG
jgi:hypothetical protein